MKRIIIFLSCIFSFVLLTNTSFANTKLDDLGDKKSDYSQIINLEKEIVESLENFMQISKEESLPDGFNIDFSCAKKVYVDTNIFSLDTVNKEKIEKELKNSTYMWLLLLNIGDDSYQIHIAKGLPLDESVKDLLTD